MELPKDEVIDGRYMIMEGSFMGGQAMVCEALDLESVDRGDPRIVALKTILRVDNQESVKRFKREALIHASMEHPHILKMLDTVLYSRDGVQVMFCVLEWIEGGRTLGDLLEDYKRAEKEIVELGAPLPATCVPIAACLKLMSQVADAVAYAHASKVVHRDLKPSNVLLAVENGEMVAKVSDFGTAKAIDVVNRMMPKVTATGDSLGTPSYMSPEQIMGIFGESNDGWSFGVTLYELLSGVMPFEVHDMKDLFRLVSSSKDGTLKHRSLSELGRRVPFQVEMLIEDCLNAAPEKRPSMSQVAARLKAIVEELPHAAADTVYKIVVPNSSYPPRHDPDAVTSDLIKRTAIKIMEARKTHDAKYLRGRAEAVRPLPAPKSDRPTSSRKSVSKRGAPIVPSAKAYAKTPPVIRRVPASIPPKTQSAMWPLYVGVVVLTLGASAYLIRDKWTPFVSRFMQDRSEQVPQQPVTPPAVATQSPQESAPPQVVATAVPIQSYPQQTATPPPPARVATPPRRNTGGTVVEKLPPDTPHME